MLIATLLVVAATVALPYTPLRGVLGLTPLPGLFLWVLCAIVVAYIVSAELMKAAPYRVPGVDSTTGGSMRSGSGVDGAGFDATSGNAFAANADGTLMVIERNPGAK